MRKYEVHSKTVRSIVALIAVVALAGAAAGVAAGAGSDGSDRTGGAPRAEAAAASAANETVTARIQTYPPNASERDFERNDVVALDASQSTETDDTIDMYEWDVDGDGEFERTGELTAVRLDYCGERTVTLRVTNTDSGETATAEVTLSTT